MRLCLEITSHDTHTHTLSLSLTHTHIAGRLQRETGTLIYSKGRRSDNQFMVFYNEDSSLDCVRRAAGTLADIYDDGERRRRRRGRDDDVSRR